MTIGFLINTCEPFYRGGYERRVWAFARELARKGHDVRIYTSCPRDEIIEGVSFLRLGAFRPFFNRRGVRNIWSDVLFTLNICRLLFKLRVGELAILDVCATPFIHLPVVAIVAGLKKIRLTLTCHEALLASLPGYVRERGHRERVRSAILLWALIHLYRIGMGTISRRIAVSQRTDAAMAEEGYPAEAVIEFGLEPEVVLSHGPVAGSPPPSSTRFVYCGRLTPIKSVAETVAAFVVLFQEGENAFHFDIIGEGSERRRLEKLVGDASAEACFTFHGEVSEAEKRRLLAASEVFILSSPREGFSIATLEAMAQGCAALIVSDPRQPNGALDFVRHDEQGICVPPGLEPKVAALRLLIHDSALRLRLRQGAWTMAKRYRIEPKTKALLAFFSRSISAQ